MLAAGQAANDCPLRLQVTLRPPGTHGRRGAGNKEPGAAPPQGIGAECAPLPMVATQ